MKFVQILLILLCSAIIAESQDFSSQNPYGFEQNARNIQKDRLYFVDNVPKIGNPIEKSDSVTTVPRQEDILVHGQVEPVTPQEEINGAGSLAKPQVQLLPNGYPNDRNFGFQNRPSFSLQPPLIDHGYYSLTNPELINSLKHDVEPSPSQGSLEGETGQSGASLAVTSFALNLFKSIDQSPGMNSVVSPYSIANLLALIEQGAVDESMQQLAGALQMTPQVAALAFRTLTSDMQKRGISGNILKVANNIFVAPAFTLNPAFKRSAINDFASEVTPTSFADPGIAVRRINSWVASKTNQHIKEIISPDKISESVQLVLVNAVFFKGLWQAKFSKEMTTSGPFQLSNKAVREVSYMQMRRPFKVGYDRRVGARILILPFEREQYSLMILLPTLQSSVSSVLTALNDNYLAEYQSRLGVKEVELTLPKFTIKTDTDLKPVLLKMGVTKIFQPQSGLSGIGLYRESSPQVSSAVHSAMFSIDEDGGTAAAATAIVAVALSNDDSTVQFIVDRPFLAVLWDHQLKLPLFMAKIEDPTIN